MWLITSNQFDSTYIKSAFYFCSIKTIRKWFITVIIIIVYNNISSYYKTIKNKLVFTPFFLL